MRGESDTDDTGGCHPSEGGSIPTSPLHLAPCGHDAAVFATTHWHYSKSMPSGKILKFGVWEYGKFIGVVLFSRGANNNIGAPFGLSQIEVCELTRVALTGHRSPVTKIISVAIILLRKTNPGLRLIISYADPEQGHEGVIYRAGNWVYLGRTKPQSKIQIGNKVVHKRTIVSKFGSVSGFSYSRKLWKHKYAYPIGKEMNLIIRNMEIDG